VPIPLLCQDGFNEAYYGRPEKLLDDEARPACSAWSFVDEAASKAKPLSDFDLTASSLSKSAGLRPPRRYH